MGKPLKLRARWRGDEAEGSLQRRLFAYQGEAGELSTFRLTCGEGRLLVLLFPSLKQEENSTYHIVLIKLIHMIGAVSGPQSASVGVHSYTVMIVITGTRRSFMVQRMDHRSCSC